jgi:hypothetical protein
MECIIQLWPFSNYNWVISMELYLNHFSGLIFSTYIWYFRPQLYGINWDINQQ